MQMLLFPDARPLVERFGAAFFREVTTNPGVYLMRDASGQVLYVGKAKNLRKRLGNYRVANPDRVAKRHLRLLRAVQRIDLEECPTEQAALDREAELLQNLRPRFNRAGTWKPAPRFIAWRAEAEGLEIRIPEREQIPPGWTCYGPLGGGARFLRTRLMRLIWCAVHPERGWGGMPQGWAGETGLSETERIPCGKTATDIPAAAEKLTALFSGDVEAFCRWVQEGRGIVYSEFTAAALVSELAELRKLRVASDPVRNH